VSPTSSLRGASLQRRPVGRLCPRDALSNLAMAGTSRGTPCTYSPGPQPCSQFKPFLTTADEGRNTKTLSRQFPNQLYFSFRTRENNGKLLTSFLHFSSLKPLPFPGALGVLVTALSGFFLYLKRGFFVFDHVSSNIGGPESSSELAEISSQQIPTPS